MNAEQKQRALSALDELGRSEPGEELTSALMMAQVLRELIAEQPASVPDEQLQAAFDRGLKAGNEQSVAQQIEIHKLHDSLAAPQPEPLNDERIFELFLEKAVDKGTAGIYDFARAIEREILG